jgi:hypothetical protein
MNIHSVMELLIRELMEAERHESLAALARRMKLTQPAVWRMRHDRNRIPSLPNALIALDFFGYELVKTGKPPQPPQPRPHDRRSAAFRAKSARQPKENRDAAAAAAKPESSAKPKRTKLGEV